MLFFKGGNIPPGLRRFFTALVIGGIVLVLLQIVFSSISLSWLTTGLVVLFAAWYAQRGADADEDKRFNQRMGHTFEPLYREERSPAIERKTQAQEAAELALRNAGHDPQTLKLHLHDIGLMVYRGPENPAAVARVEPIRMDASHIRPFIKLQSPLPKSLAQEVTFEVLDQDGTPYFRNTGEYEVRPGANLLTPKNWLPLQGAPLHGRWMMRVLLGSTPLAVHRFKWRVPPAQSIRELALNSDGELEEATSRLSQGPMSLDELLSDQNNDLPQKSQNARKDRR